MKKGFERVGRSIPVERAMRGCFDKKVFDSKNQERDWAAGSKKRFGEASRGTEPYHCHVCGKWHLTKLSKQGQSAARARNWKGAEPQ